MSFFKFKKSLLTCAASMIVMTGSTAAMAEVKIKRDEFGVPKIEATTNAEMWKAFGFIQARDRIIQMDILRQTSLGTLPMLENSPILPDATNQNAARKTRNIKVAHKYNNLRENLAKEIGVSADDFGKQALACFAEGVNGFRSLVATGRPDNTLSPCGVTTAAILNAEPDKPGAAEIDKLREYNHALQLEFGVTPWIEIDVVALFHLQVMDEFSNRNTEMNNLQNLVDLTRVHGNDINAAEVFNTIKWSLHPDAATTIPATDGERHTAAEKAIGYHGGLTKSVDSKNGNFNGCKVYNVNGFRDTLKNQLQYAMHQKSDMFPYHASNWWVVSQPEKAKTDPSKYPTGILFNGPQITALDPSKTYQVSLKSDEGFQVSGNSYPGTINFWQGFNGDLSFGLTAGNIDVSDIFCVDAKEDAKGLYYETKSGDKHYLEPSAGSDGLFHTKNTNWAVEAIDKNPVVGSDVIGTAYIQRYNWQGSAVSSLFNWMHAINASSLDDWNAYLDHVGGNFNMIGMDKEGTASYRLTGSLPLKVGMELADPDPRNWNYYPSYDPRLPAPMAPEDAWQNQGTYYHKLRHDVSNQNIANWNQKPFINMPDGDLDYDSYFRFDRVNLIINELNENRKIARGEPWKMQDMFDFNGRLQRLDVNYFAYRPFLQRLPIHDLNREQAQALKLILNWNGMRGDHLSVENDKLGAEYGHVLFYHWVDAISEEYASIIANHDEAYAKKLMETLIKTKQPYFPYKVDKATGNALPRATFLTSHGIHINSRIILNDLHSQIPIPLGETTSDHEASQRNNRGLLHTYDKYQAELGKAKATDLMIGALVEAIERLKQTPEFDAATFYNNAPHFPSGVVTYSAVSNTIAPNDVQVGFRNPGLGLVRHFRNRGALNIGAGFVDGKMVGGNVTHPGIREYRGFNAETHLTKDQMSTFSDNYYRKMYPLSPKEVGEDEQKKTKILRSRL